MRIGQLARKTGVTISRIRFYEARGLLPEAPREHNGYRNYPEEAVARLEFVDQAQGIGFSLAEIHEAIAGSDVDLPAPPMIIAALEQKNEEIERLIQAAEAKKIVIAVLLQELRCAT